jgi:hypothetical protein
MFVSSRLSSSCARPSRRSANVSRRWKPDTQARQLRAAPSPARSRISARAARDPYDPIVILSLIGRLFLVLAGGFFLRAMTEAGVLAAPVGIAAAFLYALVWLYLADRAARLGQSSVALFHAIGAAMVAFPLLVEATVRFQVIGVAGSLLGLVFLTLAFLFVVVRRRVHFVAWITVGAALPTALVLLLKTGFSASFAFYLVALGAATLWLAYAFGWTLLRWPVALVADLTVAGLTLRALAPEPPDAWWVVMLLQVALVGAYLGGIAIRTLLRSHNVTLFETTQTVLALMVGFGGAIFLARSTQTLPALMGLASLVFGVACYALAFKFIDKHEENQRNVYFYTTLALVLMLAGLELELRGPWPSLVFGLLAVLLVAGWSRHGRLYMLLHGAVYVVAAAFASMALSYAAQVLVASLPRLTVPAPAMVAVVVASAVAAWLAAQRARPAGGSVASGMRVVIVVTLVWTACGCVTGYVAPLVVGSEDGVPDAGALATVRTLVLVAATLLVAWVARHPRFWEWAWLVYPLLVFTGLKMVAQDFNHSRPATLFIALAFYGVALIVAPRLRRSGDRRSVTEVGQGAPTRTA